MGATDSSETYFYVHTFSIGTTGRLQLLEPERITVCGRQVAEGHKATAADCGRPMAPPTRG